MEKRIHVAREPWKRESVGAGQRGGAFTLLRIHAGTLLLLLLLLASAASAQNEQWLQYRSATEAREIVADIGYQYLQASSARPPGVRLPAFKSDQPLFLDWKTPMVAAGKLWMAFDKSNPKGQYDQLHLDANGNGDLSDDPVYKPYRRDSMQIYFGPVKIVFASDDGPITYHLSVELRVFGQTTHCLLTPACWYEGQITVGGVKKQCQLIDHNVNGAFNDKSLVFAESDRIRIGAGSGPEAGAVGKYVEVDDKLYRIEIARDGACVTLTEAPDVPYGAVRVSNNLTAVAVSGENGSYIRKPEKGAIKLPVGAYWVDAWSIARTEAGAKWELKGVFSPGTSANALTVARDEEAQLPCDEPIYSVLQVRKNGSVHEFSQRLEGGKGERIMLTRNGSQPSPPKLRIRSRDGSYDRALSFEYG